MGFQQASVGLVTGLRPEFRGGVGLRMGTQGPNMDTLKLGQGCVNRECAITWRRGEVKSDAAQGRVCIVYVISALN
jgi:hypothetical protein